MVSPMDHDGGSQADSLSGVVKRIALRMPMVAPWRSAKSAGLKCKEYVESTSFQVPSKLWRRRTPAEKEPQVQELNILADSWANERASASNVAPSFWEDGDTHMRWTHALEGRRSSELSNSELRVLLTEGMPLKHRLELWPQWFRAPCLRHGSDVDCCLPASIADQIDLDVPRTRPQWLGEVERSALRRVLRLFAVENTQLGYCQGLNDMASVFVILGFDESTARVGLTSLVINYCPGYHASGLKGYHRDVAVMEVLARRLLPGSVCRLLDTLDVPLDVLASKHILSLTASYWPLVATVKLWDLIFLEGQPAVFASFLALVQLYLPTCRNLMAQPDDVMLPPGAIDDDVDLVDLFQKAVQRGVEQDHEQVLHKVSALIRVIPQCLIDELRHEL